MQLQYINHVTKEQCRSLLRIIDTIVAAVSLKFIARYQVIVARRSSKIRILGVTLGESDFLRCSLRGLHYLVVLSLISERLNADQAIDRRN